jgi:hypothetical protein
MENDFVVPTSSIKLDCTAKGLVVPTIHVYVGATNDQLEMIRMQAIDQLKKTIIELNDLKLSTVIAPSEEV